MKNEIARPKWIVFDWNGTLIDDLDFCIEIQQISRFRCGLEAISRDQYLENFGFPLINFYLSTGFDFSKVSYETITQWFMEMYYGDISRHQLFADVHLALDRLHQNGFKMAILSASRHERLVQAVENLGISHYFQRIMGISNDYAHSKLDELKQLLMDEQIQASSALFVGDTHHDAEIAQSQGIPYVLIPRGHQSPSQWNNLPNLQIFNNLDELSQSLITTA